MPLIKLSSNFTLSVFVAYTLASLAHTQRVLAGLLQLDVNIPFGDRLAMYAGDWVALYLYLVVIAVGFLIAFTVMALIRRLVAINAVIIFTLGGALAMLGILISMREVASLTPIAGARGAIGMSLQILAGAIGGSVFGISHTSLKKR